MLATSYHNVKMPKRQTSFNPEWTKELEFISKRSRDAFHGFCTLLNSQWILHTVCICEICFYIICLFIYYLQKSRNVMFSGTVPDYLFMYLYYFQKFYVFWHCARLFVYVFILFPEVQKCYVFSHCALQVHLSGQFLKQTSQCLE